MNKFIKQYPQFWEPKIGDNVKIVKLLNSQQRKHGHGWGNYWCVGDEGKIISISSDIHEVEIHQIYRYDRYSNTGLTLIKTVKAWLRKEELEII